MAYDLLAMRPDLFCGVVVTSANIRPETAEELARMDPERLPPILVTHSKGDATYNYDELIKKLTPLGDAVTFITVEGGHGRASVNGYLIPGVQEMLFLQGGAGGREE